MELALIVSADQRTQSVLRNLLLDSNLSSVVVGDLTLARNAANKTPFGVALIDMDTLGHSPALELISGLRRISPVTSVVALVDEPSFDLAVLSLRQGASDVVPKTPEQLAYLGQRAVSLHREAQHQAERNQLLSESARLNEELLYKLTDTARRVGELRALLSHRGGSPLPPEDDTAQLLLVEEDGWLAKNLGPLLPKSFQHTSVVSGGAALDSASERIFDLAVVKESLPDLPGRMVVRTLSAQAPETLVLLYVQPQGKRPGRIDRIEGGRLTPIVAEWHEPKQLAERLAELHQAQLARRRERRYLAEFRAENFDLLRRFAEMRKRLRPVDDTASQSGPHSPAGARLPISR